MTRLTKIEDNVRLLFNEDPSLLNSSYNRIIIRYWIKYDGTIMANPDKLTNVLSIDRAIRKIRNNGSGNNNMNKQAEYKEYALQ